MTTENANDFISQHPPLRAEVERTLRLRAWKDETFRQELIANPKGVIQRLFPEYFPDGKAPEQMTYEVIEEDQYTHHIILPVLPDELLAPELPKSEFVSQLPPLREEVDSALRLQAWKDETFRQELIADPKGVAERLFPECFPNGKVPEQVTYKVIEEDQYTKYIILPALPDEFLAPEVPEEIQLELIANMGCKDLTLSDNCFTHRAQCNREDNLNESDSSPSRKKSFRKPRDFIRDRAKEGKS